LKSDKPTLLLIDLLNSGDTILNPAPLLFREDDKGTDTLLEPILVSVYGEKTVMPAKAGIQKCLKKLDSRLRGNDNKRGPIMKEGILR